MKHTALLIIVSVLLLLTGCATPIAAIPQDATQKADEIGPQRAQNINGNVWYVESMQFVFPAGTTDPSGALARLMDRFAETMTYTHTDGDITASGSQQGSTEQGATLSGTTGAQSADAAGELTITPGG